MQSHASYTEIGLFSIASYPYSFKLLWSPIVDSVYNRAFGRRKSWIVPIQFLSSMIFIKYADYIEKSLRDAKISDLTVIFFVLILLAATQDIAVDGWALTLLSKRHVGYVSMCQTIGMNLGFFMSFTVFLALNDPYFCKKYLKLAYKDVNGEDVGIMSMASYMKFWGCIFIIMTILVLFKKEKEEAYHDHTHHDHHHDKIHLNFTKKNAFNNYSMKYYDIKMAYKQLWKVIKLPTIQRLSIILMTYRLGFLVAESAAPLKLLEKGVSKEALASLVLIEFPMELISAIIASKWSSASGSNPLTPWIYGYSLRLILSLCVVYIVFIFPLNAFNLSDHPLQFISLTIIGTLTSFTSTLMFTSQGSFFSKISDPVIGGTYITLLNTIANLGFSVPKLIIFWLLDVMSLRSCHDMSTGDIMHYLCPNNKVMANGSNPCTDAGGVCQIERDGFYLLSIILFIIGLYIGRRIKKELDDLQKLSTDAWHVSQSKIK